MFRVLQKAGRNVLVIPDFTTILLKFAIVNIL